MCKGFFLDSLFCSLICMSVCILVPHWRTFKLIDDCGKIVKTLPRNNILRAQTPQVFAKAIYSQAIKNDSVNLNEVTDDNSIVETLGVDIKCVDLGNENIKITTPEDLLYAEFILRRRGETDV